MITWYAGNERRQAHAAALRRKLGMYRLDAGMTATELTSALEETFLDLEELDEGLTEGMKTDILLNAIAGDPLYESTAAACEQLASMNVPFSEIVGAVRARETRLDATMSKKTQREVRAARRASAETPRPKQGVAKNSRARGARKKADKRNIRCYGCGMKGHYRSECTHSDKSQNSLDEEKPQVDNNGEAHGRPNVDFKAHRKARRIIIARRTAAEESGPKPSVIDGGADQCIVSEKAGWRVMATRPATTQLRGAGRVDLGVGEEIVTAIARAKTETGQVVCVVVNEAVNKPDLEEALLQPNQMRKAGVIVNDALKCVGGEQSLDLLDGLRIPLARVGAVSALEILPAEEDDMERMEVVVLTTEEEWDPYAESLGQVRRLTAKKEVSDEQKQVWARSLNIIHSKKLDATLEATTHRGVAERRNPLRRHIKSRFPHLQVRRLHDDASSDSWFASVPSVRGFTGGQIFHLRKADWSRTYLFKTEAENHRCLHKFITDVGAPRLLKTDNAQSETGMNWSTLCRRYAIRQCTTEPYHPQQNRSEHRIGLLKRGVQRLLALHRAPIVFWCYAVELQERLAELVPTLKTGTEAPYTLVWGETPDRSAFYEFEFYAPVIYLVPSETFPSNKQKPGRWLGVADNVGDVMTYYVIDVQSKKILVRSVVRPMTAQEVKHYARELHKCTMHFVVPQDQRADYAAMYEGEMQQEEPSPTDPSSCGLAKKMPVSLTIETEDDGADINENAGGSEEPDLDATSIHEGDTSRDSEETDPDATGVHEENSHGDSKEPDRDEVSTGTIRDTVLGTKIRKEFNAGIFTGVVRKANSDGTFSIEYYDGDKEDMTYDEILELISQSEGKENAEDYFHIVKIQDHRLMSSGRLELLVLWDTGDETWEPLSNIRRDDPVTAAEYIAANIAEENKHRKWAMKILRVRRATTLRTRDGGKRYKYGIEIPRSVRGAIMLDRQNNNNLWREAIQKEMNSLRDLGVFSFYQKREDVPAGYQFGRLHMVFDVKHDLRHKARLVAGGNTIDSGDLTTYGPVMNICSLRVIWTKSIQDGKHGIKGDIGTAYLHAKTNERVMISCGPEFEEQSGHFAVLEKAIYGLKTSAHAWAVHFGNTLLDMGFQRSIGDECVWMKRVSSDNEPIEYDYLLTHVDDFIVFSHNPAQYVEKLREHYSLKDVGAVDHYLGQSYVLSNGFYHVGPTKYVAERISVVEEEHGDLRKFKTPMALNDHPEGDTTELLDDKAKRIYQSRLGELQWIVQCGRIDIAFAVNSMAAYTAAPKHGHMARLLRIYGYVKRTMSYGYVVDPHEPRMENVQVLAFKDELRVYGDCSEERNAHEMEACDRTLRTTIFVDADHAHDTSTRRSVTGVIVFVGCTPVRWISKRQKTVETSSYGSEFAALRTAVEEAMSIRYMLRGFGIPVNEPTLIFSDNMGVIQSASMAAAVLKKKHTALSFHRVREAVAMGIVNLAYIPSECNVADILTKSLAGPQHRKLNSMVVE